MKDKKPSVDDGHKKRLFHVSRRMLLVVLLVFVVFAIWLGFKVHREWDAVAWVRSNGGDVEYNINPLSNFLTVWRVSLRKSKHVVDLTPLANLTKLERLDLTGTQVTDLTPVENLPNLVDLGLSDSHVTDLTPLANLTNLKSLNLHNTRRSRWRI